MRISTGGGAFSAAGGGAVGNIGAVYHVGVLAVATGGSREGALRSLRCDRFTRLVCAGRNVGKRAAL